MPYFLLCIPITHVLMRYPNFGQPGSSWTAYAKVCALAAQAHVAAGLGRSHCLHRITMSGGLLELPLAHV